MAKSSNQPESSDGSGGRYRLELVGLTSLADRPGITVQAIDAKNDVLSSQRVDQDGNFTLPADVLRRAAHVVVGASDDKDGVKREGALRFSAEDFRAQTNTGVLALAEPVWSGWRYYWTCVSGSVRVCRRRPRRGRRRLSSSSRRSSASQRMRIDRSSSVGIAGALPPSIH